jgi:glycosyltransferase involved in cell wall biosynthesis
VEYVDPTEVGAIRAGLERLLRDDARRAELGERARARAKEFSWERFAARTLAVLERVGARGASERGRYRVELP